MQKLPVNLSVMARELILVFISTLLETSSSPQFEYVVQGNPG